jgi:hypothetical protein
MTALSILSHVVYAYVVTVENIPAHVGADHSTKLGWQPCRSCQKVEPEDVADAPSHEDHSTMMMLCVRLREAVGFDEPLDELGEFDCSSIHERLDRAGLQGVVRLEGRELCLREGGGLAIVPAIDRDHSEAVRGCSVDGLPEYA